MAERRAPAPAWHSFVSGAVAGASGTLVGHAFDTLKVHEQLGRRAQRLGPLAPHDDDERREHAVVEHRLPPRVVDADDAQLRERLARLRLALGVAEARVHVEQPHAALERRRLLRAARERRRVPRERRVGRRRLQPGEDARRRRDERVELCR